jgi:hypothetical protein
MGVALLRRWLRWNLEHNPIGWLEQRSWSGRLMTWGWCAVIVATYSFVFARQELVNGDDLHSILAWLLVGSVALSAAGSLRRERETGVLELLLVSPVGERSIILGRLCGLWIQFLPAAALLLAMWLYLWQIFPYGRDQAAMLLFMSSLLTLPAIGLYFSLRCRNSLSAFLLTLAVGLLAPLSVPGLLISLGALPAGDHSGARCRSWPCSLSLPWLLSAGGGFIPA